MAVAYRSTATVEGGTTCSKPSGAAAADVLVAAFEIFNGGGNAAAATITPPGGQGWTLVTNGRQNSLSIALAVYYKSGTGAETDYTFSVTGSDFTAIAISAYSGCDPTTPVAVGESNGNNSGGTAGTDASTPGYTVARDGGLGVWCIGTESVFGDKSPAGYTNRANFDTYSTGDIVQNAGTVPTTSVTIASSLWAVVLLELQPEGGGGGGAAAPTNTMLAFAHNF